MAYPDDPLAVTVEFWNGSSWVDITDKTFVRDGGIFIRRGFPDEGTTPEPSECRLTVDNRTGDFSPRNPSGIYYGKIGRNTPVQVTIGDGLAGDAYMAIEGTSTDDQARTPDATALDITGDIDVRIDLALDSWTSAALAGKYTTTADQRSWAFVVDADGNLSFAWSTTGASGTVVSATSTVTTGLVNGQRKALRATLDVNNGASGKTVTFYTADTIDDTWTILGTAVTTAGTTSIFSSSANLEVGHVVAFTTNVPKGKVYAFQLRSGIDGTEVANPDFREQDINPDGSTDDFTDDAGRTWTLRGETYIHDPGIRMVAEVSEWPVRWDVSESDIWTAAVAQGILRRLGQGNKPVRSPLTSAVFAEAQRLTTNSVSLLAYYPMEEGTSASQFADALANVPDEDITGTHRPMTYSGDKPDFASLGPLLGSDKIPVLGSTTKLSAPVPSYVDPLGLFEIAVRCIMDIPPSPSWSDNTSILRVHQEAIESTTVDSWEVRYKTGGSLQVRALAADGTELAASGTLALDITTKGQIFLGLTIDESVVNVGWTLYVRWIDDDGELSEDGFYNQGTFSSLVVTRATRVVIAPNGGLGELAVGHLIVSADARFANSFYMDDTPASGLVSFAGELAGARVDRIATELALPVHFVGDPDDTEAMGAQAVPSSFIDAFNETWAADLALAYETRDSLSLSWRTRRSLYNQPVKLTLDYTAAGEIAPDLTPIDDDQRVRNDITVKRKDGSSARAVDTTSRMGSQDPPDGVGLYEEQVEVNLYTDEQLPAQAQWRLHLGTWDEARYPQVVINMAALAAAGKTDLIAQVCALDVGDRIQLTNLPAFAGTPGTVDLMVLGFQETLGYPTEWTVTLNCVPYGPYFVFEVEDQVFGRLDTSGSSLALGVDSDDTSLLVATDSGKAVWINSTDRPDDFPFALWVGGEVVTVTDIDGTTSPQTFTVTRSVNGVTKSHDAGTDVRIASVAVS